MRTVTLSGTSNSGTILSVGTPDSSTGRRSKSTTSTWNSRSQRELTVNQLSGKLGADHARQRTSDASLLRRLEAANEQIRRLRTERDQLRRQLAQALGERRLDSPKQHEPP